MSKLFFIVIVFKIYRTFKSKNLSFDHNYLIKNLLLFCKFLSPLKLHRNGFVLKICVWISVFRRKNRFENPILGCRNICKINTAPIFLKDPVVNYLDAATSKSSTFLLRTTIDISAVQIFGLKYISAMA